MKVVLQVATVCTRFSKAVGLTYFCSNRFQPVVKLQKKHLSSVGTVHFRCFVPTEL